jgi:hypothetical protein
MIVMQFLAPRPHGGGFLWTEISTTAKAAMWRSSAVYPFWIPVVRSFTISEGPGSIGHLVNWSGIYLTQTQQTNAFTKRLIDCSRLRNESFLPAEAS